MTNAAIARTPSHQRQNVVTLGMAQLAPKGISEDWWLKYLGDVHWQLIADAVGQNTTVFRDAQGRQLYAAFCATEFKQLLPDLVGLGQEVKVQSALWAVGRSRIQSNHRLLVNNQEVAQFRLVSTFVAHLKAGVNASVRRTTPYLIPVLAPAPDDFAQIASAQAKATKKGAMNALNQVTLPTYFGTDFNAVGLLYFPSFTRLFEQAEVALADRVTWSPVRHRRVLYFGNIEAGETLVGAGGAGNCFELWKNCDESVSSGMLAHCSLTRF